MLASEQSYHGTIISRAAAAPAGFYSFSITEQNLGQYQWHHHAMGKQKQQLLWKMLFIPTWCYGCCWLLSTARVEFAKSRPYVCSPQLCDVCFDLRKKWSHQKLRIRLPLTISEWRSSNHVANFTRKRAWIWCVEWEWITAVPYTNLFTSSHFPGHLYPSDLGYS